MYKKVVQRLPVPASPGGTLGDDLGGLIDLIEVELDLSTGNMSLRARLSDVVSRFSGPEGVANHEVADVLIDAVRRLEKIEGYMIDFGFETARDSSED
jgi:hypothetical protein